jgi:CBS-domain-containing membrane protein
MKASDVMTRRIVSVAPDASIEDAVALMLKHRISGLPVLDASHHLVGIITEGDFLRRAETGTERSRPRWLEFIIGPGRAADEYVRARGRKVGEIMTRDLKTVAEDTPLDHVVALMEENHIKRLPVMRGDELVGIVSRANLLHALASLAREGAPMAADDASIRERLIRELEKQFWAPLAMINIIVRHGVVEYWGSILEEHEREALKVAAENIPGVTGVRDHLALVDPASGTVIYSPDEVSGAKAS